MRGSKSLFVALVLVAAGFAGCIGGSEEPLEEGSQAPPTAEPINGTIDTIVEEGFLDVATATPVVSFNFNPVSGNTFSFPLDRPGNATGYVIEVTWEATTPASEQLDVWVRLAGAGNVPPEDPTSPLAPDPIAETTSQSPLHLALAEEDIPDDEDYEILVRAPSEMGAGLAIDQPFELHVSTFLDKPFDPEFSALA